MELSELIGTLSTLLPKLLFVIIYGVGLVLAFARRARHPNVSLWAALGFGALLLSTVLSGALQAYIVYASASGGGLGHAGFLFAMWGMGSTIIQALGTVALMVALFGWRRVR